jgi:hypothetical protein
MQRLFTPYNSDITGEINHSDVTRHSTNDLGYRPVTLQLGSVTLSFGLIHTHNQWPLYCNIMGNCMRILFMVGLHYSQIFNITAGLN